MGTARKPHLAQKRRPGVRGGEGDVRAQTSLAEVERRRYKRLYDAAPVGILELDLRGVILEVNRAAANLIGVDRGTLRGAPLALIVSPADRAIFGRHLAQATSSLGASCLLTLSAGELAGAAHEPARRAPPPPDRDVQMDTVASRDGAGRACLFAAIVDGAARRRAEQALSACLAREAAERSAVGAAERRVARIAAMGSLLGESLDLDQALARVTRVAVPDLASFCAVDLADEGALVRRGASAAAGREDELPLDPYAPRGSASVVRTGEPLILAAPSHAEVMALADDPAALSILFRRAGSYVCLPLRARGRVIGAITFVRPARGSFSGDDIALVEDFARHAAQLLANALTYREAQDIDRRKNEFLAMLGHELRNPLAAIVLAAGRLRFGGALEPGRARATEVIERQSGRLSRIVDDLLDVSRIAYGKITLRQEPTALGDAVARAIESARPAVDAKKHALSFDAPSEPVVVRADVVRLEQIVVNLLSNAARYTEPGGRVAVEVAREGGSGVVRVRDTGAGIAPEMMERIFEPFTRVGADLDRGDRGLGIGLTLSRGLAELHGGSLTAESPGPGRGSEFVLRIPLAPDEQERADHPSPSPSPDAAPAPAPAPPKKRLLVVEDEPDVAEMLRERLVALGHEVRLAEDGLAGVAAALESPPDILLVDLGLPQLSGYGVASRLRGEPALAASTLVALTGYGDEATRRRCMEAGFDHHLTKPIPDAALLDLLGR